MTIGPRRAPPTEVLVVLPTYNESQNLEQVVAGVRRLGHDTVTLTHVAPEFVEAYRIHCREKLAKEPS